MIVFPEHRYFGESMPFGDKSFEQDNVRYLNIEQTMTDYVKFMKFFRQENGMELTPCIAFGGSYGGMLAAWLRMKFPETFQGAVASSAPIRYFRGANPDDGFYQVVNNVYTKDHPECSANIKKVGELLLKISSDPSKIPALKSVFNTCQDLKTSDDMAIFTQFMYFGWVYMAMTNYPYPTDFLAPMPGWPVEEACRPFAFETDEVQKSPKNFLKSSEFTDEELKLLEAAAASVKNYYNYTGDVDCYDINMEAPNPDVGLKGWKAIACNEVAMTLSTDGKDTMFIPMPFSYENYAKECMNTYGLTPQYDFILTYFGGKNPKFDFAGHSNIVFVNGLLDPWSSGSITENIGDSIISLNIEEAAHHLDLREPNRYDPKPVREARDTIKKEVRKWIRQFKELMES